MKTRLFLLPGFLGEPADFAPLIARLRDSVTDRDFQIQVLDWMNFSVDPTRYRLEEMGEVLHRQIQVALQPGESAVVMGYSLGGRLALSLRRFQRRRGEIPMRFIFVSTNPGLSQESEKGTRRRQDRVWAERFRGEDWKTLLEAWNRQTVFTGSKAEPDRSSLRGRREQLARVLENWSLAEQMNHRDGLEGSDFFWVTGGLDKKFCALARGIPHHQVIPSASHRVHLDAPRELAERMLQFLSD